MANSKFKLTPAILVLVLVLVHTLMAAGDQLSMERQHQIIDNYLMVTGRKPLTLESAAIRGNDTIPVKCGMSAVADFVLNRSRMDRRLLASVGLDTLLTRPQLAKTLISPSGRFMIHYVTTGDSAVYQSQVVDGSGVPIFVDSVAAIADRAWTFTIDSLGYPAPPSDSSYDAEGPQFDIYLFRQPAYFFGLTYLDSTQVDGPGSIRATSFMELDNDYSQIPGYVSRPLDAVRVTVAHEFFHSVQFGIDFSEAEIIGSGDNAQVKRYWMEMSAVWMEEQQYTNINDYYSYLPYFFDFPRASLQQFNLLNDYHPYGSVVYPLYLSQKFGRDIIKDIWIKCGQFGAGPSFLAAADSSISLFSHGTMHWTQAFTEFELWNFFTGARSVGAPAGVGYTERANYPIIPDSIDVVVGGGIARVAVTQIVENYQLPLSGDIYTRNQLKPEHNAAAYMRLSLINDLDRRYWTPGVNRNPDSICVIKIVDSLKQSDTLGLTDPLTHKGTTDLTTNFFKKACPLPETTCTIRSGCSDTSFVRIDSTVTVYGVTGIDLPSGGWGIDVVYHYLSDTTLHPPADSYFVESFVVPDNSVAAVEVKDPRKFESVTLIWSPASTNASLYHPGVGLQIGFVMDEVFAVDSALLFDSSLVGMPGAILTPYPNPAVVSQMGGRNLKFRVQVPTDSTSFPITWSHRRYTGPVQNLQISVDLFNVAGERVRSLSVDPSPTSRTGVYETNWDMKNEAGKDVVSGVYIAVARFYVGNANTTPVAEKKVKVLIVR